VLAGFTHRVLALDDLAISARSGFTLDDDYSRGAGFLVHNQGATAVTLWLCESGGGHSTDGTPYVLATYTGSGTQPVVTLQNGPGSSMAIPAGATRYIPLDMKYHWTSAGGTYTGSRVCVHDIKIQEGTDAVRTVALGRGCVFTAVTSGAGISGSGGSLSGLGLAGAGIPFAYGASTTTSTHVSWGTVQVGVLPAFGRITVTGGKYGANGAGSYHVALARVVQASWTGVGGVPATALPNLVWNTDEPSIWEGAEYVISLNGQGFAAGPVVLDENGNFDYTFDAGPAQLEYITDMILSPDGEGETELPVNNPDGMAEQIPDPSHDREDPEAVNDLGPEPKTDSATNDTVAEEYRAVRAAIEDAMHGPAPSFDFDAWQKPGPGSTSAEGEDLGTGVGGAVGGLAGMVGAHAFTLPGTGTTEGLTFHAWGGGTAVMMPPVWAGSVRVVMLIICSIFFFLAMLTIVRGGFAGR